MLLKRLAYISVWILIPDYVLLQTITRNGIAEGHIPCDHGWYNFREKCFKVSGAREHLDWNKASNHCSILGANLATIESIEENDFLVGLLLLEIQASAWIGLHDKINESDYKWDSGSNSDFRNWREGEPSGVNREHEDCVQLLVDLWSDSVGEWNDNDCKSLLGYICEKKSNPEKSSPNLKNCSTSEGGGFRFKNSCYHLVTELKTWDEAEQHCIDKHGGHLITILDKTIDFYLKYQLQGNEIQLWTGIKIRNEFQQQWSSGWYVGYNGFKEEEPDLIEGTCVIRKHRKEWGIVPCSTKYAFICEKSSIKPPVLKPAPKGAICPSVPRGWRDVGGEFCYYIETSKTFSWYEANFECIRRDGHLLSIHSKEESEILHPFIQYSHVASYIGLIKRYSEKEAFKWTDGSELDFTNWAPGEPNSGNEICVETRRADMKWNDIECKNKRPYICSIRKINPSTTVAYNDSISSRSTTVEYVHDHFESSTLQTSTTAAHSGDNVKVSGHISQKILIGVTVCFLLVIIILSIIIYKFGLCRKKAIDAQLHNYKDMAMNEQDC